MIIWILSMGTFGIVSAVVLNTLDAQNAELKRVQSKLDNIKKDIDLHSVLFKQQISNIQKVNNNEEARYKLINKVFENKIGTKDHFDYIKSGLISDLTPEHRQEIDNYLKEQGNKF